MPGSVRLRRHLPFLNLTCGAPDYILTKKNIPVGFIEAKDIGADLDNKTYKEQFDRHKASLHNLIITNYLDFRLYRDGVFVTSISIATIINSKISGIPVKYEQFEDLVKDFSTYAGQTRCIQEMNCSLLSFFYSLTTVHC